ncbi:uncharacterized protein [Diadema antillarum]|uniref:uncharacterized protein n=1 Tax=Diadema antillarum TaxID=105358 RepID=UPI003A8691C0
MDYEGTPEPIDFDFFDYENGSDTGARIISPDRKSARPSSGKRSDSARGNDGDYDRESVRSVASSRSSVSVRIPTAAPAKDDGNEADYYSEEFESDKEGHKDGDNTFRFKDDIESLKERPDKSNSGSAHHNFHKSYSSSKSKSSAMRKSNSRSRPKTAKNSKRQQRSRSSSSSSSSYTSASEHSDSPSFTSESESSTRDHDSVTDVSPLQSPRSSPIPKLEYDEQEMERETEKMRSVRFEDRAADSRREKSHQRSRPKSAKFKERPPPNVKTPGYSKYQDDPRLRESEANELSMLLRAVLEMDETPNTSELSMLHKNLKRPLSGKRKNRPQSAPMPHQRMNMSFSNDEVKRIDRENQRLLQKIVGSPGPGQSTTKARTGSASHSRASRVPKTPMSHSAVQRQRDQRRIEIENMQILRRIEAARANPQVKKDSLIRDYRQQMQYAAQVSKTPGGPPARPSSAKRTVKAYNSGQGMSKASSMSSLGTEFSGDSFTSSSTNRSRSRRAKYPGYEAPRPAWNDRWQQE